jgi:hypothetical protein
MQIDSFYQFFDHRIVAVFSLLIPQRGLTSHILFLDGTLTSLLWCYSLSHFLDYVSLLESATSKGMVWLQSGQDVVVRYRLHTGCLCLLLVACKIMHPLWVWGCPPHAATISVEQCGNPHTPSNSTMNV